MNKRLVLMIVVAAIAFVGALVYNTLSYQQYRVEVCMEFQGRTNCRTALGKTQEVALRTATENACATIASGMTESMACDRTPPKSVRWLTKQN